MDPKNEVIFTFVIATLVLLVLVIFIVTFALLFQRRQTAHKLEKASLKAQYESEILNAENEIQESTMKHISRELHDNVGQLLTLVKLQLNTVQLELPKNTKIANSREYVAAALTDVRALSKSLNNDNILQEGLAKAIDFELGRIQKTGALKTHFANNYDGAILDHKKEILVFRMFQELAQNCLKHAQAKNIWVNLEETQECFNLEFKDDGIGFELTEKIENKGFGSGAGLNNLRHRAALIGGELDVSKNPNGGMLTIVSIPNQTPKNDHRSPSR
jgi:signal transduction histidine kinase